MKTSKLTPSNETQLQHWIEKLKAADAEYDIVSQYGKAVLEVDPEIAETVLGIKPKKKSRWYVYVLAAFFGLWLFGTLLPNQESEPVAKLSPEEQAVQDSLQAIQARRDSVEAAFSAWDGSHVQLTKYIKENLNDRDSYEHVQTRFWDMNNHIVIKTQFRANNAFGAKILQRVHAKAKINGKLLEVNFE